MAVTDLISRIIAEDKFSQAFRSYNEQVDQADRKSSTFAGTLFRLAPSIVAAGGALVGAAAAVREFVGAAVEMEAANTNLTASIQAANAEFGDSVGTVESWGVALNQTAAQLKIYSDQELTNATARLIDMSKRLGLTEEQMRTVLQRTADLAAGKTDLEGGIERVTAALRGEAEAAEFLGLSLNETAVRAYGEAQGVVWKELDDGQKAQLRYALLLEQTNALQGRAAEFSQTLAGQQAALNAEWERQQAALGQQLLPLYQGAINALSGLTSQTGQSASLITKFLAGFSAALITAGVTVKAFAEAATANFNIVGAGLEALASGRNPFTAINQAILDNAGSITFFTNTVENLGGVWQDAFNQALAGYQEVGQANVNLIATTNQAANAGRNLGAAFGGAAQAAAAAVQEGQDRIGSIVTRQNSQIENLQIQHNVNMARLAQDLAQTQREAAQEAAEARIGAAQKLAAALAEIDADLARGQTETRENFNRQIESLNQDRERIEQDAARNLARELAAIDQKLNDDRAKAQTDLDRGIKKIADDRAKAEKDSADKIASVNQDLADTLADLEQDTADERNDINYKAGQERARVAESFNSRLLAIEKSFADQRKRINDEFSDEFAEADPFRRKIMERNRQQALAELDKQEQAEKDSLGSQRDTALSEIEERVRREEEILDREAEQKTARLEREAQQRKEAIQQDLADRQQGWSERETELKTSLEQELASMSQAAEREKEQRRQRIAEDLQDRREQLNQREAELRSSLERDLAKQAEAAQRARELQQQRNQEEIARIDQQEQAKIQRAQQAIERERQNYQDRLAVIQQSNQQELADARAHFTNIEKERESSYSRQLEAARRFQSQLDNISNRGRSNTAGDTLPRGSRGRTTTPSTTGGAAAGFGANPGTISNNVIVNVNGGGTSFSTGQTVARSVRDALNGF